ncbi:MAG: bifunctional diaminohydroxyphosphoribosylaminopyrimidine deaminase/5-amino-6-(5-phosphoribosylamino)uracil reductase RibD, partial [Planctomycetota bacterium]
MATELEYMRMALELAAKGLGEVEPNPAVGCVIVKDGAVIGQG